MTSGLQSVTLPGFAANHARPPSSSTRPTFGISLNDGRAIARAHRSDRSRKAVHASILPHKPRKRVATSSPNHTRPGDTQAQGRSRCGLVASILEQRDALISVLLWLSMTRLLCVDQCAQSLALLYVLTAPIHLVRESSRWFAYDVDRCTRESRNRCTNNR